MCGRYALLGPITRYDKMFGLDWDHDLFNNSKIPIRFPVPQDVAFWDISPTTVQPVIVANEGKRQMVMCRWGLIPSWAKDPKATNTPFNARLDTAPDKPFFRKPFRTQRCIVPVDAFYEWGVIPGAKKKQRYAIRLASGETMGMAGLWDVWKGPDGPVPSFTILTTDANALVESIHDRMPGYSSQRTTMLGWTLR